MTSFTKSELSLLQNQDFLLQKRQVTAKIVQLFGDFSQKLKSTATHQNFPFPTDTDDQLGKISKGENYKGLPYLVLDLPRLFQKERLFAFRTMFWWGHFFSFTLLIGGELLQQYPINPKQLQTSSSLPFYFCIHESPWEHHFESDNYLAISDLSRETMENHISQYRFIKISRKIPIDQWTDFEAIGLETYRYLLGLIE